MNLLKKTVFAIALSFFSAPMLAEEIKIEATINIAPDIVDYSLWKTKRIEMQLQREHNTLLSSSLLQPAAVLGSVFFSAAAILYTIAIFSGNGNRDDAKDLVKSIEALIHLVKAPFTLQYEKNKARDRIARMIDQLRIRGLTL